MYYAMEFIDGPALSQMIDELRRRPLPEAPIVSAYGDNREPIDLRARMHSLVISRRCPARRARHRFVHARVDRTATFDQLQILMADVADGLQYAHLMQVVHRDIKPSNLLLSRDGRIYISDFGLARLAEEPGLDAHGRRSRHAVLHGAGADICRRRATSTNEPTSMASGQRFTSYSLCDRRFLAIIASK